MPDPIVGALDAAVHAAFPGDDMIYGVVHDSPRAMIGAAVLGFLDAIPMAWVRDTYGTDEAVFLGLLREAATRAAARPTA